MFICECDKCNGKDWKYEIYLLRHLNRKKFTGEPRKPREEKKIKKYINVNYVKNILEINLI